jgi:type IX secretion system PorP/SprF family membrane protein
MKRLFQYILIVALLSENLYGQGVFVGNMHYGNSLSNPLDLNPAFAGTSDCVRLTMGSLMQNGYHNAGGFFSADAHINKLRGGLGIRMFTLSNDNGNIQTQKADLIYSHHGKIGKDGRFAVATNWGVLSYMVNLFEVFPDDFFHPQIGHIIIANIGLGVLFGYKNFAGGYAADYTLRPNVDFISHNSIGPEYTFHGYFQHELNKSSLLKPGVIFRYHKPSRYNETTYLLNPVLKYQYKLFNIAAGYKYFNDKNDYFSIMPGISSKKFYMCYNFEFGFINQNALTYKHELLFVFKFMCNNQNDNQQRSVIDF